MKPSLCRLHVRLLRSLSLSLNSASCCGTSLIFCMGAVAPLFIDMGLVAPLFIDMGVAALLFIDLGLMPC